MKSLGLILLLTLPAAAQWPRMVFGPKGGGVDNPPPHSLKYFTEYPRLRDESRYFCPRCTPEQRLAEAKQEKAQTDLRLVAMLGEISVYDLFYYFGGNVEPEWKSLLVRTGPDEYREIYHDQPTSGKVENSFMIEAGESTLVGVVDEVHKQEEQEHYFLIDQRGVIRLDFGPVWDAAQKLVPDVEVMRGHVNGRRNFPAMAIPVGLIDPERNRCCGKGVVTVAIKLDRGRVVVIGTKYDRDAEYPWN